MNTRKTKILFAGESSYLSTGYAIYTHEVLSRLHATNKYDIAEFGIYGHMNDPQILDIPWTFYANLPDDESQEEIYNANPRNQFGQWKFEEICLDFQPDIVCDIRDWCMGEFVERSPFRPFYHWAIMPTIDSIPQPDEWLSSYIDANAVFAYAEFGRDYLLNTLGDQVNFQDLASPAANYDIMKPVPDKETHRQQFGMEKGLKIVGTVMRNQKRKLYPDLIQSFANYCAKYPEESRNVYLYLHTSYPDKGWDIPLLIREAGLGNKTLFTYICSHPACKHVFPSFFQDSVQACPKCGRPTAGLPSTHQGVTTEQMAQILNFFDIYLQYSVCEGFGMPQVEAAACGLPIISVEYSAMKSVLDNLKCGYLVPVQKFFYEETLQKRALPDNQALVEILHKFFLLPEAIRLRMSRNAYRNVHKTYTWDKAAKSWEIYFDSVQPQPIEETWQSPKQTSVPNLNMPQGLTNEQFVRWGIMNIWGQPERLHSYMALRMIRDLNYGKSLGGAGGSYFHEDNSLFGKTTYKDFTREQAAQELLSLNNVFSNWDNRRLGLLKENPPPFIHKAGHNK